MFPEDPVKTPSPGFWWGQTVMHDTRTGQFNCPNSDALYHLIETEAGPETVDLELTCVACGAPLSFPAREGPVVFKYFLSGGSRRKARKT
jgi:hypothetical protein